MQEGALLCFGLCALWIAAHIARQRATRGRAAPTAWIILIAACALTLANKHSGAAFVAAAFMGIAAAEWTRRVYIRRIVPFMARLIGAGAAVLALFVVLSPALWNDPSARLRDLLMVRAELLDMQVTVNGGALTLPERLNAIITQPFFALPIHYEAAFWGEEPDILDEIERYHAAGLSGFYPGVLALLVLGLAAAGIVSLIGAMRGRRLEQRAYAGGLLMTLCVMIGVSLASPLAWQRYYLPLLPVVYLCAACAPRAFWHAFDHDA
jgi:4-amino-4-deoxy-L-arabinose transferase-like glycosyltransferase